MSKKNKILAIAITLSVLLISIIATIVVVLVADNMKAKVNVKISYQVTDVACDLSATYFYTGTSKQDMTINGIPDNDTVLSFDLETAEGTLSPTSDIVLDRDHERVVFEYKFTNKSSIVPMSVNLIGLPETQENVSLTYYVSSSELAYSDYDDVTTSSVSLLGSPQAVAVSSTKYIYIFVNITDLLLNANFVGEIKWDLTRAVSGTVESVSDTINNNPVIKVIAPYAGNTILQNDLSTVAVDATVLNWYTFDGSNYTPVVFPLTSTANTVLYGECLESTVSAQAFVLDKETDTYVIDASKVASASTVSFTTVGAGSSTQFVIPDMYNGTNGVKPVTKILDATTGILANNTTYTEIYIGNCIHYVGRNFANGASSVTKLLIPAGVKTFGTNAFANLTGLTSILYNAENANTLTSSSKIFEASTGDVIIGKNVYKLPTYMFDTANITTVNFEENARCLDLANYAFYNCSKLTMVNFPETIKSIGNYGFYGCGLLNNIQLPESLTTIGQRAFNNCSSLTKINIPSNITTIPDYAFYQCTALNEVAFAQNCKVTTIGSYAFRYCSALTSFDIPETVTTLNTYAYSDCTALQSITIPKNMSKINSYVFSETTALTQINYNAFNCADLSSSSNIFYNAGKTSGSIQINIGKSVNRIPSYMFYVSSSSYRPKITNVTFEENSTLKEFGSYAFRYTTTLTSINLPDSIEKFETYALADCTGLTSLTIGKNTNNIANYAFYNLTKLTTLNYNAVNCTTFSTSNVFYKLGTSGDGVTVNFGQSVQTVPYRMFYFSNSSFRPKILSINFEENSQCHTFGQEAFYSLTDLKSLEFPESLKTVGSKVAYGCTGLTNIEYNTINCPDLTSSTQPLYNAGNTSANISLNVGDKVEYIPNYMFAGYSTSYMPKITSITLGKNVIAFGSSALAGLTNVTTFNYNVTNGLDFTTSHEIFRNMAATNGMALTIGNNVTHIPDYLFSSTGTAPKITALSFAENAVCTNIGKSAIPSTEITSISLPSSVQIIELDGLNSTSTFAQNNINKGIPFSDDSTKCYLLAINVSNILTSTPSLTDITNWDKISLITDGLFVGGNGFAIVSGDNPYFTSKDSLGNECNVLIRKSDNKLLAAGYSTSIIIPSGVTSIGEKAFVGNNFSTITIPDTVTEICDYAFLYCSNLNNISIPSSVKTIGNSAFESCNSLVNVTFNEGVEVIDDKAFSSCPITTITLPNSAKRIGYQAFANCGSLQTINLNEGLQDIESEAFYGCASLSITTLPTTLVNIGNLAFSGISSFVSDLIITKNLKSYNFSYLSFNSVTVEQGVKEMPANVFMESTIGTLTLPSTLQKLDYTFAYTTINNETLTLPAKLNSYYGAFSTAKLNNVVIEYGATKVDDFAFNFSTLKSINMPDTIKSIGEHAFNSCRSLTSVDLPDNVVYLGDSAFCFSTITSITIPSSLTSYKSAFITANLQSVTFEEGVTTIDESAFNSCMDLTQVTLPNSLTTIKAGAFGGCEKLESITLPSNLQTLERGVFAGTAIKAITIPKSLITASSNNSSAFNESQIITATFEDGTTVVPKEIFTGVPTLTTINLPTSVTEIGDYAFSNTGITQFTIPSHITKIGMGVFSGTGITTIHIPATLKEYDKAFYSSNIQTVTFDDSITSIDNSAFAYSCLTSVTLPTSLTTIGGSAFNGCSLLSFNTLPDTITTIGADAFYDVTITNVNITDTLASSASGFSGAKIENLNIGETSKTISGISSATITNLTFDVNTPIDYYAFSGSTITNVTIPNNYTKGGWVFANSTITDVYWEEGTTEINNNVFSYGTVYNFHLPQNLTKIGDYAFSSVYGFTSLTLPETVTYIGDNAFQYSNLTNINLPNSITYIGEWAFYSSGITGNLTLPTSLKNLGSYSFYSTSISGNVTIPSGVTSIGAYTFAYTSITSVTIHSNVTFISMGAFSSSNLTSATFANPNGWIRNEEAVTGLDNPSTAASILKSSDSEAYSLVRNT